MKIAIGNDHGGYCLKRPIIDLLESMGHEVVDVGSYSDEIVRYPFYAAKVCRAIQLGEVDLGILICSTGIGMSIVANKYRGIRAALCYSTYQGKATALHNKSNVLCFGGKCLGDYEALDIVKAWLSTPYEGGRHDISLHIIDEIEETNFTETGVEWETKDADVEQAARPSTENTSHYRH